MNLSFKFLLYYFQEIIIIRQDNRSIITINAFKLNVIASLLQRLNELDKK